ncbi:MAG: MFS transporter [Candidatus Paceibacterota bacterium]|jgi:MFS family permease
MVRLFLNFFKEKDISIGTRVLTYATSVRWIGWGFAETLISVFIFSFATSYAQAGLLKSMYEIALIIMLPLAGIFADRIKPTTIILIGLSLYVIVGTSYLFAGLTGLAIFIVIARLFNGFGAALDSVGRETYFRRNNLPSKLATVFGYFDTVANFWWIVAALFGIILVKFVSIHWLLFLIVPTVIISIFIVWKWGRKNDSAPVVADGQKANYKDLIREFKSWNLQLKLITGFNFFIAFTGSIISFFLPIQMFTEGSGYTPIILLGVIVTIPVLFGWVLGKLFDKKGMRVFVYGLIAYGVLLLFLGNTHIYGWQILLAFLIGIIQEFIHVGKMELTSFYANSEHFGRVDGFMQSIINIGIMTGPLVAGILIDVYDTRVVYFGLAFLMLMLAFTFAVGGRMMRFQKLKENL